MLSVLAQPAGKGFVKTAQFEVGDKIKCRNCLKNNTQTERIKNPGLAALLSFIWTGPGQIYNGQVGKGFGLMILDIVNFFLIFIGIGIITGLIIRIYSVFDAYTTAKRINEGELKE
jgi:TM2 domain-containing membrane protein YozV